jgi:hypothetical protein
MHNALLISSKTQQQKPSAETAQPITSVVMVKNFCHETLTGSDAHPA